LIYYEEQTGHIHILLQLLQTVVINGKRNYVSSYGSIPLKQYIMENPWDSFGSTNPVVQKYITENLPTEAARFEMTKKKIPDTLDGLTDYFRWFYGIRYVEVSLHTHVILFIKWARFTENETYLRTGGAMYEYTRSADVYLVDAKKEEILEKYSFSCQTNVDNPYENDDDADMDDMNVSTRIHYMSILSKYPALKESNPLKMYTSIEKTPFDGTYVPGNAFNGKVIESKFMEKAFWWLVGKIFSKKMEKLRKED
jgi:hypothetical protein